MRIAIHGRPFREEFFPYIKKVIELAALYKVELVLQEGFAHFLKTNEILTSKNETFYNHFDFPSVDCVFSIGGDGTLLEVVTFVGAKEIPILGINVGRLGYLATLSPQNIEAAFIDIINKNYKIDKRTLINLESNVDLFQGANFGLNEFAILKRDTSSMIIVHTYLDGEFLNSYWADGLLVSTPTGSTGYSLSCGGPVVMPQSGNFIITPVSPHNLNVRPLVIPDTSELSFTIEGRGKNFLVALDSRSRTVEATVSLKIKKEVFTANLIALESISYLTILRSKLNWGSDTRN